MRRSRINLFAALLVVLGGGFLSVQPAEAFCGPGATCTCQGGGFTCTYPCGADANGCWSLEEEEEE